MLASTPTLDLETAVNWRLVPKARRQGPTVAGNIPNALDRECATGDVIVPRSLQPRIQPNFGDAMEFALFAVNFAVIGWLHLELLALLW